MERTHLKPGKKRIWFFLISVIFLGLAVVSCKDDEKVDKPVYDPSKPVEFTKFIPEAGGVGTQLILFGENFGSDTSLIRVFVNDKKAPVIGVNGQRIYAVVPSRADTGRVRLEILGDSVKNDTKEFVYLFRENVSTICGRTDNDGNGNVVNGKLADAWLKWPVWMAIDKDEDLYTIEWELGLRVISRYRDDVTSPYRVSGDVKTVRTCEFTQSQDTLLIANAQGNANSTGIITLTRPNGFNNPRVFVKSAWCSGALTNPVDKEIYYTDGGKGLVLHWDKQAQRGDELYNAGINVDLCLAFSPDGKTIYIAYKHSHYIVKASFDPETKKITDPIPFVGQKGVIGNKEGITGTSLINVPTQMVIDKEGYMYFCDSQNHCIRKVTPGGLMTTYAGTPGVRGYEDGPPLKSKFYSPEGIVADSYGVLFIADTWNNRIRKIEIE